MSLGLSYEKARAHFTENAHKKLKFARNTVDAYWKHYKKTIRQPAKACGLSEKEFCDRFFQSVDEERERSRKSLATVTYIVAPRHRLVHFFPRGLTPSERREIPSDPPAWTGKRVRTELEKIAGMEGARLKDADEPPEHLVVTISYRTNPKKKKKS
jgi:hypothetical protein